MSLALRWPEPDPLLEAGEDSPFRRAQRAARAAREVSADVRRLEGETTRQLLARLTRLRADLQQRLAQQLTDPQAPPLDSLIRQIDTLIADATVDLVRAAERPLRASATLGMQAADHPMRALQVQVVPALPGTDAALIAAADDNVADLLTPPMRQFATDIKTSLRRVAVAGAQRMEAIQRLQAAIAGQGFDNAQYRAERIVRTELGRVFGEATFARMTQLAQTFPFLKKAWVHTRDRRTRLGHVEAGTTYARGKGIAIAERFVVPVYQEGPKGAKRLGEAQLRFPIDPLATPAGKLAASASILCRCHAVIDVDPKQFADFARVQVQIALGNTPPPLPPVPPPPIPPAPRVRARRAPRTVRPQVVATRPADQSVAQKLQIPRGPRWDVARDAMSAIEQVHGDGPLRPLPLLHYRTAQDGNLGGYDPNPGRRRMLLSTAGRAHHPHLTLWHETGHWLDDLALGATPGRMASRAAGLELREWRDAVERSGAIRTLRQWLQEPAWITGPDGRPMPNPRRPPHTTVGHLVYLLSPEEMFARSYAQWIAQRSQHPSGLVELAREQARARENPHRPYPSQWEDDDFAPIAAAFDRLFALKGWR